MITLDPSGSHPDTKIGAGKMPFAEPVLPKITLKRRIQMEATGYLRGEDDKICHSI